jgi:serine/threonine-protein kinase PRP4
VLEGRYQIYGNVGRGVFSTVLRAKDLTTTQDVAIKVIRNNDVMFKAGQKELTLLKLLASRDPEDKKHCIRLLAHFEFKNHLCLVFEPMAYL